MTGEAGGDVRLDCEDADCPGETCLNAASYQEALPRALAKPRELVATAGAAALVGVAALALWLATGVHVDEIARFVPYELGFVVLPGVAVYRAVVVPAGGRLRQLALGWSLGYLLEVLAFLFTAAGGVRGLFYAYPALVGVPAAVVAWKRRVAAPVVVTPRRIAPIWIGAALCVLLLGYVAVVGFTQTPLPRDVQTVTYQEDTPYVIALAAEALHHWPMTLPMVSGEPLHYHLFTFLHLAAVSQVTGIDLSVVVLRLYEVPLLLLFALQLFLLGRRVGRSSTVGLLAVFVVLFLGELDAATGTQVGRFLFRDLFFYWLTASHSFLFGFVFFIPAVLILGDLLASRELPRRLRYAQWLLACALLIGCVGAKSYSVVPLGGGLLLVLLWRSWFEGRVSRTALGGLTLVASVYLVANVVIIGFISGGAFFEPLKIIEDTGGVEELSSYFSHVWGTTHVPGTLGVAYGIFGLLGIPLLGVGLLVAYRRCKLTVFEGWLLALLLTAFPPLLLTYQPGFGPLFLVFYAVVPGAILAASGYRLFWLRHARAAWRPAVLIASVVVAAILLVDQWLNASARVGIGLLLFCVVVAATAGAFSALHSDALAVRMTIGIALVGLVLLETPLVRLLSSGAPIVLTLLALAVIAFAVLVIARQGSVRVASGVGAVGGILALAVVNTPLDWFPQLLQRSLDGNPLYSREYTGLTADLYAGLTWIRDNTPTDAVLVVNNHSLHPDGHDSKYFYYSAFAERRIVLESWDYTEQTLKRRRFSLDRAHSPFPRRLALSDAVFDDGDEDAIRTLASRYGATYLVADKVHGSVSPHLAVVAGRVFSNQDVDVYAVGVPGTGRVVTPSCESQEGVGIAAVFGDRTTVVAAQALRRVAEFSGFPGLDIQRRGCKDYAVVLTGLKSLAEAREFKREAASARFGVTLECRTTPVSGGLNAVFGHTRTRKEAEKLAAAAAAVGFAGLRVQQDACGDWEVDLAGLKTAAQRLEFRDEAARVGFRVVYEPG